MRNKKIFVSGQILLSGSIYIVIYRQICFVLSELISVTRQYLLVAGIETRLTQTSTQDSNHSATRRYYLQSKF